MKRALLFFTMLMVAASLAYAQQHQVAGKVVGDDGNPIPFATVRIKGTKTGTAANADGRFFFNDLKTGAVLIVSAIGMEDKEVTPSASGLTQVILKTNDVGLKEIVVTGAFGIKKSERANTYSAQVVNEQQLNVIPHANVNEALAGKVAGVQFMGQSTMKLGSQGTLRMRGGIALTDKDPIYVIDGTITSAFDINPDDIENITVLKGANATALFGSRAAYGAIVMTSKKGRSKGIGIEVNQGITADRVYILPEYQNTYAGGASPDLIPFTWTTGMPDEWKPLDGKSSPDFTDDGSWGPKMEGQEYIPWYSLVPGTKYTGKTAKLTAQPNNVRDFYNTGITNNTNINIARSGDNFSYRLSYTNQMVKGLIPGSSSRKNTIFFSGSYDLNAHFSTGINISNSTQTIKGNFDDAYSNQSTGSFNSWFHRDLDMGIMKEFRNVRTPANTLASWNWTANPNAYDPTNPNGFWLANYWYNHYSYADNINNTQNRNYLVGDVHLTYKLNNDFSIRGTVRKNSLNASYAYITGSLLQSSGNQTGVLAGYDTKSWQGNEYDYELLATYNKTIGDFSITANAGGNIMKVDSTTLRMNTVNGLKVADLYAISNSVAQPNLENYRLRNASNSVFGTVDLGYKRLLTANFTIREDWFSSLPTFDNRLISPAAGLSFMFSELTGHSTPWLSFGKIFGSYGKKPIPLDVYQNFFGFKLDQTQWNGTITMRTPNILVDPNLKGALNSSVEGGFDIRVLNNRFGLNVTYYNEKSNNVPVTISIDAASGYTSKAVNAAKFQRSGIEALFNAQIIHNKNFSWDLSKSFSYIIDNKVLSLYGTQPRILLGATSYGANFARAWLEKGKQWGQLIGGGIARNAAGQALLNDDGTYTADPDKHYGSVVPKVNGGLYNSFTYKNFHLGFSMDYQIGGKFFSLTENWGTYSGLLAPTAATNDKGKNVRDDVAAGGGVHVKGVSAADGKTPVDTYVDGYDYFHQFYSVLVAEPFVHSLSYVKLREVTLGYTFPIKNQKTLQGITVSAVARNLWLIYRESKNFDPSEISGVAGENANFPGTRSYGLNVKLNF